MSGLRCVVGVVLAGFVLTGCTYAPKRIDASELKQYQDVLVLLKEKTGLSFATHVSESFVTGPVQPYFYAKDFCEGNGGVFKRVRAQDASKLAQTKTNKEGRELLNAAFGYFSCESTDRDWWLSIEHSGVTQPRSIYINKTTVNIKELSSAQVGQKLAADERALERHRLQVEENIKRDRTRVLAPDPAEDVAIALRDFRRKQAADNFFDNVKRPGQLICLDTEIRYTARDRFTGMPSRHKAKAQVTAHFASISIGGDVYGDFVSFFAPELGPQQRVFDLTANGMFLVKGKRFIMPRKGWYLCGG